MGNFHFFLYVVPVLFILFYGIKLGVRLINFQNTRTIHRYNKLHYGVPSIFPMGGGGRENDHSASPATERISGNRNLGYLFLLTLLVSIATVYAMHNTPTDENTNVSSTNKKVSIQIPAKPDLIMEKDESYIMNQSPQSIFPLSQSKSSDDWGSQNQPEDFRDRESIASHSEPPLSQEEFELQEATLLEIEESEALDDGLTSFFSIQVGVLSYQVNVENAIESWINKTGNEVFTYAYLSEGIEKTKIFVGKFKNKTDAAELEKKLEHQHKENYFICKIQIDS